MTDHVSVVKVAYILPSFLVLLIHVIVDVLVLTVFISVFIRITLFVIVTNEY